MSLVNDGSGNMVMPVGPMYGNGGGSFGWGNDGSIFIIILFLFAIMNGGWGGYGNGAGAVPFMMNNNTNNDVQRGFDQQAVMSGIGGIQSGLTGIQTQLCNGFAGVEAGASARQIANMNQAFNAQTAMMQGFNGTTNQLADLKYTVATEACSDRQAVTNALYDVTASNTANTQLILNAVNNGFQSIHDSLNQKEKEDLKTQVQNLQTQLNMATLRESQTAQNAFIQQGFSNEVDQLYNRLSSCPIGTVPVYGSQPVYSCNNGNAGCGCNGGF